MQTTSQTPSTSPIPQATGLADTSAAMNQTQPPASTAAEKVADNTKNATTDKATKLDKYNAVAGAISDSVQKGLSYANARRARETYNATDNL